MNVFYLLCLMTILSFTAHGAESSTAEIFDLEKRGSVLEVTRDLTFSNTVTQKLVGRNSDQQCVLYLKDLDAEERRVIKKGSLLEIRKVDSRYIGEGMVMVPFEHKAYGTIKRPKYKYTRSQYDIHFKASDRPYYIRCQGKKTENKFTDKGRYQVPLENSPISIGDLSKILGEMKLLKLNR